MYPILLTLGPWQLRSYSVILCLAVIAAVTVGWQQMHQAGVRYEQWLRFNAGAIVCGLVGAYANDQLFHARAYDALRAWGLSPPRRGVASFGGIAGALLYGTLYARRQGWNIKAFLDTLTPTIPLTESLVRVGCLLNGCCYGRETQSWAGVYLPDITGYWAKRYPTQILTGLFCLVLFLWLWRWREHKPFDGALLLSYLILYHTGRVGLDALRGDQVAVVGPLSRYQLTSLLIVFLSTLALLYEARKPPLQGIVT